MNKINICFDRVKKDCFKFIKSQETVTEKFRNKDRMLKTFLIPMCFWIANKTTNKKPYFVGLAGGQGTGKTTISSIVKIILEKHFKLNDSIGGPDASFSVNENDFKSLVDNIRMAELALGSESYQLTEKQISAKSYSRSLYVSADVKKGDIVTVENLKSVRPGYGLHPKYFDEVINKKYIMYE